MNIRKNTIVSGSRQNNTEKLSKHFVRNMLKTAPAIKNRFSA